MRTLALGLALLFVGCGPTETPASEGPAAATDPDAMCVEHGVLESLCTVCNPALVPVFRARGDFCEEHQLPESICPVCHPDREGRPTRAVRGDDAPADGTRVRLATAEVAARAGIDVATATSAPGFGDVVATARVAYDPSRVARLNPRAPGVVRTMHANIGDRVEPGDGLITIASAEVGAGNTRVSAARSRLQTAEANLARVEQLEGVVSQRDRLRAQQEHAEARAELAALRSRLGVVGRTRGAEYTLTSPITGVVTRRTASLGAYVEGSTVLVEVADVSQVWVELDVAEDELAGVTLGQPVSVTMDALDERTFEGSLEYLAPEVDPHTRTVPGRLTLSNADGSLRANMFGQARIRVPRSEAGVLVPRGAVQRARGATMVFVRVAPELFEVRRVEVHDRPAEPGLVEVRGRVEPGDEVVTVGAFLLRTETVSDSIGAGCCEGEE